MLIKVAGKPSRRSVLQRLAIGAGALPFARTFVPSAQAAPGKICRIVFIDNQNGVPQRSGGSTNVPGDASPGYKDFAVYEGSPTKWSLGPITKPLEPLKDQVVILDNMEMPAARGDTHFNGLTQLLTGKVAADPMKAKAGNISIDQYLGEKIGRAATPKFPNLVLGAQSHGMTHTHLADGTPVPGNQDPFDVFAKLTGNLSIPGSSMPDPAVLARVARRKSVLDYAAKELAEYQKTLGKEDKARAEAQLSSIRTLEQRLSNNVLTGGSAQQCGDWKGKYEAKWKPGMKLDVRDQRVFPELFQMQMDNILLAFLCDLTRVASFLPRGRENQAFNCNFAPIFVPDQNIHGLSHNNIKDDFAKFMLAKQVMVQWVADLALALQKVPEGDGTMLDHTIIFIGTENGRGHTNSGLHFLTIGGRKLGVQTGRYMTLGTRRGLNQGVPHNRLLVSFLHAMGVPDATFGDSEGTGTGPLPGYLA